jgi:predicted TIM-barrel fold metal-dependent hydrolase/GNAT superfamily N-acetyltransferase
MPFEVKDVDRAFYEQYLADFLPQRLIDAHTHVWLRHMRDRTAGVSRSQKWPRLVAQANSIDDLLETYELLLPQQHVTPVIFGMPDRDIALDKVNAYAAGAALAHGLPSLLVSSPEWSAAELEQQVITGGFLGLKPYLNFAPAHIRASDITIFDFLPHHHLEVVDAHGWIVMLHIPRPGRIGDSVNLAQMLEIERRYQNTRIIIAHIGRAYCPPNLGDALQVLQSTERMMFDISANTNADVFERFLRAFGPKRAIFGTDLPILRMRMRRICEGGLYVNLVPPGLYGDVSADPHMREVSEQEGEQLSFFLYEELLAFRRAAESTGLGTADLDDVFFNNAARLVREAGGSVDLDRPTGGARCSANRQLHMVWPEDRLGVPPEPKLPPDYGLRVFHHEDLPGYLALMSAAGFDFFSEEIVRKELRHVLPDGFFVIEHRPSGQLVATALAEHSPNELYAYGGQVGWVAGRPDHSGKGLGRAVVVAATNRLISAGYRCIYLKTDDWRLPAIKTYLNVGYVPHLRESTAPARWRAVCYRLGWPFTPDAWPKETPLSM